MYPEKPWVSFCISTYKRPQILHDQLLLLGQQTFPHFEVVVSDNDPGASARSVVEGLGDTRFRYFHNEENLGMIRSFNKSIERSSTPFIVMVTDDDPVDPDFLAVFYELYKQYPAYSMYCGFQRKDSIECEVELINKEDLLIELLDPDKTLNLLWSSAIIRKADIIQIGLIPDYGSPHLSDHAFMALAGSMNGAVIMNKMFSSLSSHDANFSKFNFDLYTKGCKGFYTCMSAYFEHHPKKQEYETAVSKHLHNWFMGCMFTLKKHYAHYRKKEEVKKVQECAEDILKFPFMQKFRREYARKNTKFRIKQLLRFR